MNWNFWKKRSKYPILVGYSVNPEVVWDNISQPAPGQKIPGNMRLGVAGTSLNVVWSLKTCGCRPLLIGAVGKDKLADLTRDLLVERSIPHLLLPVRKGTAFASIEPIQGCWSHKPEVVRIDYEKITEALKENQPQFQVVTGLMPDQSEVLLAQCLLAKGYGIRVLNPRQNLIANRALFAQIADWADWLFLNRHEAAAYLGCKLEEVNLEALEPFLKFSQMAIVTCDEQGALLLNRDGLRLNLPAYVNGQPKINETGAGDCFLGFFLAAVCRGYELPAAFALATVASGIKVTRPGTTNVPTFEEAMNKTWA